MADCHVHIVSHDGQVVGRLPVRSENHEVFDVGILERNRAMHGVNERGLPRRDLEANRAWLAGRFARRDLVRSQRAAGAVVHPAPARGFAGLALLLQCRRSAVAVVRPVFGDQPLGPHAITLDALRLEVRRMGPPHVRPLVPIEPEPAEAVHDSFHHLPGRPLGVGILDAQHECAAETPGVEPVEERRARAADVEISRGGRGKSDADHTGVLS